MVLCKISVIALAICDLSGAYLKVLFSSQLWGSSLDCITSSGLLFLLGFTSSNFGLSLLSLSLPCMGFYYVSDSRPHRPQYEVPFQFFSFSFLIYFGLGLITCLRRSHRQLLNSFSAVARSASFWCFK